MYRFIHVNKCGGNSIHLTLNRLYLRIRAFKNFDYKQKHDNGRQPLSDYISDSTKVFIFVRDPIERFLSAYRYKNCKEDLNIVLTCFGCPKDVIDDKSHMGSSLSTYLTIDDIQKYHENGQWWFVGTTENISDDYLVMTRKLRDELGVECPPLLHLNRTERLGKRLSDSAVLFLRKYFEKDYNCMDMFCKLGYLSEEYVNGVKNRMDYNY